MNRKAFAPIILLVAIMIAGAIALGGFYLYSKTKTAPRQNISNPPAAAVSTNQPGSESLCSQGAQDYANGLNQSALQISLSSTIPASSHFVVASHYIASQNTCYFQLHNQLPLPQKLGGGIYDVYTLYITDEPSPYQIDNPITVVATEVADCVTQQNNNNVRANNSTICHYYNPVEKPSAGGLSYWVTQYNSNDAPPMSQEDFQALVQRDMVAN